jgi:hypothetical protein
MAAEFHNMNFTCATSSIVPSGSNYTDVAYQSCAYAGSKAGSIVVNGDDYLAAQFGFYYSHVWRNFGKFISASKNKKRRLCQRTHAQPQPVSREMVLNSPWRQQNLHSLGQIWN